MNLCMYLKFAVLLLQLFMMGFAQDTLTTSTPSTIGSIHPNGTVSNPINASVNCNLRLDESAVENILRSMHNHITHVAKIHVIIESKNGTRIFPEYIWHWADEIGRTIISLKAQRSGLFSISSISSWHFITLNPGIEQMNVIVFEANNGCLPKGINGSELVFDFLLRQVSDTGDTQDYKLCRPVSQENELLNQLYSCCKVARGEKLSICAEYSSIVLEYGGWYVSVVAALMMYVGMPLVYNYLRSLPMQANYYEITDSPMALSTLLYTAFLEGSKNPVISLSRRLAFSLLVAVIICFSYSGWGWIIASSVWCLIFTIDDFLGISTGATDNTKDYLDYETYLMSLTLPFNIKFWLKRMLPERLKQSPEEIRANCGGNGHCRELCGIVVQFLMGFCFAILYLVIFGITCIPIILLAPAVTLRSTVRQLLPPESKYISIAFMFFRFLEIVAALMFTYFSITSFLNLMLYWIIGLYLNGSFYSHSVVPLLLFLGYSWGNWRSFVEMKYLTLKTKVYEVCKEFKIENAEQTPSSTDERSDPNREENIDGSDVNIEDGKVSKALYDQIREKVLPYNIILFHFFLRMFFVGNFCLIVFVLMLLAQKSNIAVPAQIMSAMVASSLPLIFDAMWTENTFEQKFVNAKKLEDKLRKEMKMKMKSHNVVTVQVETEQKKVVMDDVFNQYVRIFGGC